MAEKTLKCSQCSHALQTSDFSSKQLKRKGKRVCKLCLEGKEGGSVDNKKRGELPSIALPDAEVQGKLTVKKVAADVVKKAQERNIGVEPSPDDDKFDVMLKWLADGGAKFPHLQLKYYTVDYRGVHAKARLEPDQIVLEVPLKMIITLRKAMASEIGQKIEASGVYPRSSHTWLAAYLLQEKHNPQSFWKPYIDCLPEHYRNMPIFFDEEELKHLNGSFTLGMIEDRKASLRYEYDQLAKACPEFAKFHHLEFVWGRLAVITRIFGFDVHGQKEDGLVPMADMLNHKRPHETRWQFDDGLGAFTIVTTRRLLKGAQIFDSYGRKCNSRYFVNYGFCLEENEDNQVAMHFSLKPTDVDYKTKLQLVGEPMRRFQIPFDHREQAWVDCFSFLRIAHANSEELTKIISDKNVKHVYALSPRNEAACLMDVAEKAKEVMAGFETTLEEDNKLLQSKDLTMNIRNCILMRRGEKEVLQAYIDLGPQAKEWASLSVRDFKKLYQKSIRGQGKEPSFAWRLELYCKEVWLPLFTGEKVEIKVSSNAHVGY